MREADRQQAEVKHGRRNAAAILTAGFAALFLCGCGNQYRPVVSAISPVGPAGQPIKYAVAVSNPSVYPDITQPGLLTVVDVSGDTVLATPSILSYPAPTTSGSATAVPVPTVVNPLYFSINSSGSEGFVVNSQGEFNVFGLSSPSTLITSDIVQTTLESGTVPVSVSTYSLASTGTTIFVPESTPSGATPTVAELTYVNGPSLVNSLDPDPAGNGSGDNPVYVVGIDGAQRVYAISQGSVSGGYGQAASIENSPVSVSTTIPVGIDPVYGVMSTDGNRAYILNKGSGTVSVINVPNNAPDLGAPTITIPSIAIPGGTTAPNPVWADLATVNSELIVLNQGDGINPGTLSIINIPLCNVNTPVTNPNCNPANPVDAAGFGTVVGTAPVGIDPTMVSVLADGTKAYVVNQSDPKCATGEGSVSVVNLSEERLSSTICGISTPAGTSDVNTSPTLVYGHPNSIAATTGDPTGKVYVTSPDSKYMTIIETDTDSVDTHISLQGLGIRVLVTQK